MRAARAVSVVVGLAALLAVGGVRAAGQAPPIPAAPAPAAAAPQPAALQLGVTPPPSPPARTPLYRRWWFWAGFGAALSAVVITTIVDTHHEQPFNGTLPPGTVRVPQ